MAGESDGAGGQRAAVGTGVQRREAIATQERQARRARAGERRAGPPRTPATVEIEFVADDETAAAAGLDVAPIPIALPFGHGNERATIGAGPVESVAAEPDAYFVRLGAVAWLAAPDREQAEQYALVADTIQVVELTLRLQIVAARVEIVRVDPERGFVGGFPIGAGEKIRVFPVAADPSVA